MLGLTGAMALALINIKSINILAPVVPVERQVKTGNIMQEVTPVFEEGKGSLACKFSQPLGQGKGEGVMYITKGKSRTDYTYTSEGAVAVEAYTVAKDGYVYVWSKNAPVGTKTKVEGTQGSGQTSAFSREASMSYDCKPWVVDEKLFEIPANVKFAE